MRSGKEVYRDIRKQVEASREMLTRLSNELRSLRSRSDAIRADETRNLARLARLRLDELAGSRIADRLDAADHAALEILARRESEQQRLSSAIDQGAEQLAALMARRDADIATRDRAAMAFEDQVAATRQRLGEVDEYRAQQSHSEFARMQATNAAAKAKQAEADRDKKRIPYESDKLFAYLWRRRYGFPEYRAMPLFRSLDAWVARLCSYGNAHRDYGMLLEIPVRLRAHADELAAIATEEAGELAAMESAALAEDGGDALREAWEKAQLELNRVESELQAAEAVQDQLCRDQVEMDAGRDSYSMQAAATISAQLASEDVQTLRRDAEATSISSDNEVVNRIAALRSESEDLQSQLVELDRRHQGARNSLDNLEDLARKFRSRDFEASNSEFGSSFDVGSLLGNLLHGAMRSGQAWSILRRNQSWRRTSSSSPFGGFGGGGSSSSSSGFGGGGFSSGGSFGGGGGGFSTGGGF